MHYLSFKCHPQWQWQCLVPCSTAAGPRVCPPPAAAHPPRCGAREGPRPSSKLMISLDELFICDVYNVYYMRSIYIYIYYYIDLFMINTVNIYICVCVYMYYTYVIKYVWKHMHYCAGVYFIIYREIDKLADEWILFNRYEDKRI